MTTTHPAVFALALVLAHLPVLADTVSIDHFRTVGNWSVNEDGGFIRISGETRGGNSSMRLEFSLDKAKWGNAARAVTLPPNAVAIEFDVFVIEAAPPAWLALWLFEADGDGYLATAGFEGDRLYELDEGWHRCYVPISSFRYDPRGNKVREPLTTAKLLIGLGGGNAKVGIANLAFKTAKGVSTMRETRTKGLQIKDGPNGRVAVLRDNFEPKPGHSDPLVLASALEEAGYGATLLASGDLADRAVLNADNFDCLILPYGPSYPCAAFDSIKAYLKSGGSFFSTGGYTFDQASAPDESGKLVAVDDIITAADLAREDQGQRHLNTRCGRPADTLGLDPDQIGVFDPSYHLKYTSELRAAPMQFVLPGSFKVRKELQGYAACSMLGSNNPVFPVKWGRHIALADGCDAYGRLRGPVGSIAHNYDGPYAGSSWAFFGATNVDLFGEHGPLLPHLGAVIDALVAKTFLHSLATDLACYKDGETVRLCCKVADLGKEDTAAGVTFKVFDRAGNQAFCSEPVNVSLKAGTTATAEAEFRPAKFSSDLYRVTAALAINGRPVDMMETGFAAYDPRVTAGGLDLEFKDNYFHVGDRPILLSGTNVTGEIFVAAAENPLIWDRDLARMSENGISIMRVLHFSPFLGDSPGYASVRPVDLGVDGMPLRIERQLDALVQLCQKHRIVLFLTLHDWMGVALTDEELAAQRKFAKLIAERYKDVPGFMIDIQNEPHLETQSEAPHVVKLWNDFLRSKYGTDDALKAAWKKSPPEAEPGSVPCKKGTDDWDDMRTFDADTFRNTLTERWISANYSGAKDGDPKVPVTVGFLQEYFALNKLECVGGLDFANMHSYNSMQVLRADLKLFDRRFEGKSISLGEFGALPDHEERTHGRDNPDQDYMRYLVTGHYLFGEGGSFMANWCWKDMDCVVFPWGVNYPCGGPRKDILKAYRNQSLLLRQIRPAYQSPQVFLVVPLNQMLGGRSGWAIRMLYRHVDAILAANADFGVIDDRHLDRLPLSAKLLIYPIPFSIPDRAYNQLKSFVERGGTLCITGDVSYDELRRRTHSERLEELCGVRFVSENYAGVSWQSGDEPCINVEPLSATEGNAVYQRQLGRGKVRFTPSPSGRPGDKSGRAFSDLLTKPWSEGAAGAHAMRIFEQDRGAIVLVNPDPEAKTVRFAGPETVPVQLSLAPNGVGLVRYDASGDIAAIESQGTVTIGPNTAVPVTGHFALISCDGNSIGESRELIVIPFGKGSIDLRSLQGTKDLIVQTGDIVDGKWQVLSESTDMSIAVSADTAFDIRIIAPKDRIKELAEYVVSELTLQIIPIPHVHISGPAHRDAALHDPRSAYDIPNIDRYRR